MEIACVDNSATERLALTQFIDTALIECRQAVGHLKSMRPHPQTREGLLLNGAPDIILVGPGYSVEKVERLLEELTEHFPSTPRAAILSPSNYSLRNLQRLKRFAHELFNANDLSTRIIHGLLSLETQRSSSGKLLTIWGVKGGVGTTSVAGGLAHACAAVGKSAVLVDLSAERVIPQYMNCPKLQTPELAAALIDGIVPDRSLVERIITTAPNGLSILLPPAGGTELREKWVRSAEHFEFTLQIVDVLQQLFDFVIVDTASTEGILSFALLSQADNRLLVSATTPASVHLLNRALTRNLDLPGKSRSSLILNSPAPGGLSKKDILSFLSRYSESSYSHNDTPYIPFDTTAQHWIGTGNSFYTESSSALQMLLEHCISSIATSGSIQCPSALSTEFGLFRSAARIARQLFLPTPRTIPTLPLLKPDEGWTVSGSKSQFIFSSPVKQSMEVAAI